MQNTILDSNTYDDSRQKNKTKSLQSQKKDILQNPSHQLHLYSNHRIAKTRNIKMCINAAYIPKEGILHNPRFLPTADWES